MSPKKLACIFPVLMVLLASVSQAKYLPEDKTADHSLGVPEDDRNAFAIDRIGRDGLAAGYPVKRFRSQCFDVTCRYGYHSQGRAFGYGMILR